MSEIIHILYMYFFMHNLKKKEKINASLLYCRKAVTYVLKIMTEKYVYFSMEYLSIY